MDASPFPLSLQQLAAALGGKVRGNSVRAPGPGHSAGDDSLDVMLDRDAPDGFVVHSYCPDDNEMACRDYVRQKANFPFKPKRKRHPFFTNGGGMKAMQAAAENQGRKIVAVYPYTDDDGKILYEVVKYEPKGFAQRRPNGAGGHIYKLDDVRRTLYRRQDLRKWPDALVWLPEGEKDCDSLWKIDLVATCVASNNWTQDCIELLAGRNVVVLADKDEAGRKLADQRAAALYGVANSVRVLYSLPGEYAKDVTDWLEIAGNTSGKLADAYDGAPEWSAPPVETLIRSSDDFTKSFIPPDYLIDGLLQRGNIYSLTAATGTGKTALALLFLAHVALGRSLGGREIDKGRGLMLVGENPPDICARWIAMAQQMDFDVEAIDIHFIPRRFKLSELIPQIRQEAAKLGGFDLLVIDTSAAYFEGENENDNVELGKHAHMIRTLNIPGNPCTIINCHPTKNAHDDNLVPRGGGAFLNEVDGNLVAKKDDMTIELHWQGKFRGPDFAPISFKLETVTHERLKDSKGRQITTVIAKPISEQAKEEMGKVSLPMRT